MIRELSEIISDMRNIVKPYIAKQLKQLNFECCGSTDKAEFETEFEMVLTLAEMANQVTPQEPCEDAVSRKNVWSMITGGKYPNENDEQFIDRLVEGLEKMPPVTPQPKTGHWIFDNYNWRCSECNETPKTMGYVGTADFMTEHFKFCNHCGAKMIEPQEREDKE